VRPFSVFSFSYYLYLIVFAYMSDSIKAITLSNASACSAFELRQELVRRGAFDINPDHANYQSMLQRLIVELVNEEEHAQMERAKVVNDERQRERDAAKRERELRKAEAQERSRLRREQDPAYFARRQVLPTPVSVESATSVNEPMRDCMSLVQEVDNVDEKENSVEQEVDIFRAYKPTSSSRIFVK
jgi:hypothetical protein